MKFWESLKQVADIKFSKLITPCQYHMNSNLVTKLSFQLYSETNTYIVRTAFLFFYTIWTFYKILQAKWGILGASYMKAHSFENCHPEWMPFLPSDSGLDSNPRAWKPIGPQSMSGSIIEFHVNT